MFSSLEVLGIALMAGVVCLLLGLAFGFTWSEASTEKKRKAKELETKQQKMWNEYLSAMKGGNYGK